MPLSHGDGQKKVKRACHLKKGILQPPTYWLMMPTEVLDAACVLPGGRACVHGGDGRVDGRRPKFDHGLYGGAGQTVQRLHVSAGAPILRKQPTYNVNLLTDYLTSIPVDIKAWFGSVRLS